MNDANHNMFHAGAGTDKPIRNLLIRISTRNPPALHTMCLPK
jgi:hypothetical protein